MSKPLLSFAASALLVVAIPAGIARADAGEVAREVHQKGPYPDDLLVEPPADANGSYRRRRGVPVFGPREDRPAVRQRPIDTSWLEKLGEWLEKLLGSLGVGKHLGYVLFVVGLLVLSAGIAYLISRLRLHAKDAEDEPASEAVLRPGMAADPLLVLPELTAEELRRLGRFREAVHALFVASLFATGYRPAGRARSRTAREIVAAVDADDARKPHLATLLSLTEYVWFGGREATDATYERARALHDAIAGGAS